MKSSFNSLLSWAGAAVWVCGAIAVGQEPGEAVPTPSPAKSVGWVRVWNYSYLPNIPRVAVFLGARSEQVPPFEERIWLKRGMTSPGTRDWTEIKPGKYEVYVLEDDAVAGNMGKKIGPNAPAAPSLLGKRQEIAIEPGTYQTIVLTAEEGKLAAQVLNDGAIPAGAKRLRVFRFHTEAQPGVTMVDANGAVQPVVAKMTEPFVDVPAPAVAGPVTCEVSQSQPNGVVGRQNVELDFAGVRSCSLVIAPDRRGKLSITATADAPATSPAQ
jgi:hypothetical protein